MTKDWTKNGEPQREWKPKVWLVCPTCDELIGYVHPKFLKRSGTSSRRATPPAEERPDTRDAGDDDYGPGRNAEAR